MYDSHRVCTDSTMTTRISFDHDEDFNLLGEFIDLMNSFSSTFQVEDDQDMPDSEDEHFWDNYNWMVLTLQKTLLHLV